MGKLFNSFRKWSSLFLTLAWILTITLLLAGCVNVYPTTKQVTESSLTTSIPSPTETKPPIRTVLSSATPASDNDIPLPRIEAFVADPSYNPGGSRLSKLGDAKVSVDTAWQSLSNQPYYYTVPAVTDNYKPYDINQLQKVLNELKKTPWTSLYKLSYFDCSDMSALLQRELAIRGFESWIVIGKDPNIPSGHAWVVVFLKSPTIKLVPVEATALIIPQPGSSYTFSNGVVQTYDDYSRQGWVLQDIVSSDSLVADERIRLVEQDGHSSETRITDFNNNCAPYYLNNYNNSY